MEIARRLFEVEALTQNLCKTTGKLSLLKLKILYFIDEYKSLSPSLIVSKLGLKRSNLAILSKSLQNDGYIDAMREDGDRRRKRYSLTLKGKNELNGILKMISTGIREDEISCEVGSSLKALLKFLNRKV